MIPPRYGQAGVSPSLGEGIEKYLFCYHVLSKCYMSVCTNFEMATPPQPHDIVPLGTMIGGYPFGLSNSPKIPTTLVT